ncbi:hypothetical protein DPMN_115756 [Dreissena polymorpha]|uniref:Uncharacterized protein n=1 Tax=Dreissena polymorpha TaxID=45954 RepID=A0A9D4KMJ4_DREPO|nr:hypothetical protein DPMN_115756 [Dreissena polymorpha]
MMASIVYTSDQIKILTNFINENCDLYCLHKQIVDEHTHAQRTLDITPSHKLTMSLRDNIIGTNLLIKFHEDRKINVASRVLTSHVFQPTGIIFEIFQDIIGMNLLTKFHEDWTINFHEDQTINVASRKKNAPPLGSHVFQANITIFELIQDIIEINLLTKFHED